MHFEPKQYNQNDLDNIKRNLLAEAASGQALYFDVKLDDAPIIRQTNNPERFDEIYTYVNEKSRELVISVYSSPIGGVKDFYNFQMYPIQAKGLNGLTDVEKMFEERLQIHKDQTAMEALRQKLKETEDKLKESEDYIEALQEEIEAMKVKPNHIGQWDLGRFAASAVKEIAINHPNVLEKVPVLNGIARVIQEDHRTQPKVNNPAFEGEVTFKRKGQKTEQETVSSDDMEALRQLGEFIGEHFDQKEKVILGAVIESLGNNPEELPTVASLLNIDVDGLFQEE